MKENSFLRFIDMYPYEVSIVPLVICKMIDTAFINAYVNHSMNFMKTVG